MKSDTKKFLVVIVSTAILLAALGTWALCDVWRKMWEDEQKDLNIHAELISDALMAHARLNSGLTGPPPQRPRKPGQPWDETRIQRLKKTCDDFRKISDEKNEERPLFIIRSANGDVVYAEPNFPKHPKKIGLGHLKPPIGNAKLITARVDGGLRMRSKAITLVSICACLVLLVVISVLVGGWQFVRLLHQERLDSQRKTDFIDNVSHELTPPLAGIRLNAELLAENRVADAGNRGKMLNAILLESDRLSRMVDKLLDFSRIAKGRRKYAILPVDLVEFTANLLTDPVVAMIAGERLSIKCAEDDTPREVLADTDALRQIVVNLIDNAAKYTNGDIEIGTSGSSISVSDCGPGIPPEYRKRIFDRFFRIDNTNDAETIGSGLGLPIARDLARGMGGDLTYAPRECGGSIFKLTLPTVN